MYGLSRFADKLKIQNRVNSSGNYVNSMFGKSGFTEKLKIQKFVNSARIVYIIYVQNIWIYREIEYLEI